MAAKRKSDSDWVSWVVIAVLFLVGLAPIALVVLLVKLFGRDGKQRTRGAAAADRSSPTVRCRSARPAQQAARKSHPVAEKKNPTPKTQNRGHCGGGYWYSWSERPH